MDIQISITNPSVAVIRALAEAVNQSIDTLTPAHTEVAAATVSDPVQLSGEKEAPADAAPQTDKPKRQRKPQPEKSEQEEAPDAKTEAEPETEPEEPQQTGSPAPTVVELRAKAQEVGTSPEAKKAIKALLDKFGSKSLSEVPEDNRAEFLAGLAAIPGKLAEGRDA